MKRNTRSVVAPLILALSLATPAHAQTRSMAQPNTMAEISSMARAASVLGNWEGPGGTIRVEPCANASTLCAVVVSGTEEKESMWDIVGQTVVKEMVSISDRQWRGRYVADGKDLPATITLANPDVAELRVCLLSWFPYLLCEQPTYTRVMP